MRENNFAVRGESRTTLDANTADVAPQLSLRTIER